MIQHFLCSNNKGERIKELRFLDKTSKFTLSGDYFKINCTQFRITLLYKLKICRQFLFLAIIFSRI